jgi:RNA polymerase sigma-54 factor
MDVRLGVSPVAKPKPTPKTVVVSGLLELPSGELEQAIQRELAENPALQVTEAGYCERCGSRYSGRSCPHCDGNRYRGSGRTLDEEPLSGRWLDAPEDEWDPFSTVAAPWSLRDHLLWQLSPQLSSTELEIASLLLENLDEHGFLDCDLESIALAVDVPVGHVREVLSVIQRQEPVGVGARTVEESLLIQLETLEGDQETVQLSRSLIQGHWESLCKGKLDRVAKSLLVSADDVAQARDFISSNLHPYPIAACVQSSIAADSPVDAPYLRPDVIISVHGLPGQEEFEIQFPAERCFHLGLDQAYQDCWELLGRAGGQKDAEGQEHVRRCLERSQLFISGWRQRWLTLRAVVQGVADYQREYLLHDATCLRPLTRAQLAQKLGLHESTVSRAVASKYALLPAGHIVALADFFDGSLRAKAMIKDWISHESGPLTDGELVDLLSQAGITVARRTVAKYRQELKILPSELR